MTSAEQPNTDGPNEWVEKDVRVVSPKGFHVRPLKVIAGMASFFEADVVLRLGEREVDAKSILEMMLIAAVPGTWFTIRARGVGAEAAVALLAAYFEDGFGEMDAKAE